MGDNVITQLTYIFLVDSGVFYVDLQLSFLVTNGAAPCWKAHVGRHRQAQESPNSQRKMQRVTFLSIITWGNFSHSSYTEED